MSWEAWTAVGALGTAVMAYIAWRQWRPARKLTIGPPTPSQTSNEYVPVHGSGAVKGSRVLIVNMLVGSKCWLQPREATPDSHGDWIHPGTQLNSLNPRYVYAISVRERDVARVRAFFEEHDVTTAGELAKMLRRHHIKVEMSKRWSLERTSS